ncbi:MULTISPECIES: GNAT family N-acetyltransferase [Streptomyces]|uniref:GCN5-related N-acetyltransferase n=1 Tax=Streptomyces pratensis (strain ATCC 33331 / IAF-45CD) TaxID=591167 RepID=A0A8D4BGJ5_STRFA|nr:MULTISPECIES: N-acetyltransferase [Streptomyces]MDF9870206.1 ribosomal protein S18 acetylase RimI-like enzyme [Streptomyces pratensis]MDF0375808.1 GNAT family N-acetyltransferase [Streptomyces sp. KA12]MDF6064607.1 GNAT family N-acetyltransferase [Streptomyces sp. JH010]MDX2618543.1 N-acetyltransferase [Streptomyces sp. WI03-5b]MYT50885.1 GNAT family N-acetyltransferase [Streptomyces sp. SID7815]
MDVTIRPVRAEEYEALGEITAQAYLGDGLLDFGTGDPYLEQLRAVGRRAAEALVLAAVDAGGELLGGVTYVAPGSPWADVAGPDEAEFRMLAVSGTARGRGAGEALVRACVDRARAAGGLSGIVLSTQSSMEAAHRIYRRLGFVRTPERDWSPLPGFTLLTFRLPL